MFANVFFMEAPHLINMSKERYIGVWRSVNDIQAQAGSELFNEILNEIENMIQDLETVPMYYKTRAWTVQSLK